MKEEQTIVINLSDNEKGKVVIWMNFICIMEVAENDKTILFWFLYANMSKVLYFQGF